MKRYLMILAAIALSLVSCQKYDTELDELQQRLDQLETDNSKVNGNVEALAKIVEELQKSAQVTSFTQIVESGNVIGYTVNFKEDDGSTQSVTIYNSTVNVSVGTLDGKYYWMVDGNWLTDDSGNKIEACAGAVLPQFRLVSGVIEASLDGGASWKNVGEVGTPVINNVIDGENEVVFQLSSGTSITLSKFPALKLNLGTTSVQMAAGGGRGISYTIIGGNEDTSIMVWARDGWQASVNKTDYTKGYIEITAPDVASESEVLVIVSDNSTATGGRTVFASISVKSTL